MSNNYGWTAPTETAIPYIQKCKTFSESEEAFNNFRQDDDYTKILEGKSKDIGDICYKKMKEWHKNTDSFILEHIDAFKENDKIGSPSLYYYPEIREEVSPGTMKYISDSLHIFNFLENFKPETIFEIGAGYGGMCKTISSVYDFKKYFIFDLPEVILLSKKYLDNFKTIKNKITYISTKDLDKVKNIDKIDLVIADASFAECDIETQEAYTENIILKSNSGYIVYNTLHMSHGKEGHAILISKLKNNYAVDVKNYMNISFILFKRQK